MPLLAISFLLSVCPSVRPSMIKLLARRLTHEALFHELRGST